MSRDAGMFSLFSDVFFVIRSFENKEILGAKVDFGKEGLYYDPKHGDNWWTYYFEPINLGHRDDVEYTPLRKGYYVEYSGASRKEVNNLIQKYIHLKPFLTKKIDSFVKDYFENHYIIGVHYRGTDKFSEAPRASYERVPEAIEKLKSEKKIPKNFKIFIATDEAAFLDFMKGKYGDKIIQYEGIIRSTNRRPVHTSGIDNFKVGEDAITDCVLLSKTQYLIRTSSNLSLWSTYFNPDLPVLELTKRHRDNK